MTPDARFEDGRDRPLNLGAMESGDLAVLSALAQDAVFPVTEIRWHPRQRRLALLVNRLRHEDTAQSDVPERVQALLIIDNVLAVASQGIDRADKDVVLSLLSVSFAPELDAAGHVILILAGDGAFRAKVEALDVRLKDVTQPYLAVSGKIPQHPD